MEDIIRRAKEGDREAMYTIIDKYKKLILKKAYYYSVPGYGFEDLVQHGYLSVIKAVKMYKLGSNSYNGYIINSINFNFAALLKGTIKNYREIPDDNILNRNTDYDFTLEDEIIAYDEVKKLYKALDMLEPYERQLLEKHYFDDEPFTKIARTKGVEYQDSIKERNNVFKKLRNILDEESL